MIDKMNEKKGEILSPAGNFQMLEAAVRCGADAVYLGAKDFSARRNAENFTAEELKTVAEYCHIRGVKAYLTLNILIKDSELGAACELARGAYLAGIDGVIIQDIGLASILRKAVPGLALHASTQMSVMSPKALPYLKKAGFKRVVAAREMSLPQLKIFCREAEKAELETEVFVHGALCMSVSGQCKLSAYLGSRSGNRGLCAGPCRLPFSVEGGTGHDLSLKDLSLLNYLSELCDIGVTSLKIEGRMKRPEYVAAATAAAYAARDKGCVPKDIEDLLKNVFSRSGFTDGYYTENLGRDMFGIRTKEDVTAADTAFSALHSLYRGERQSVKISVALTAKADIPLRLTLSDGEHTVTAEGEIPQAAQNKPITTERIKAAVDKFGSTPYLPEKIDVICEDGLFIPAAEINSLRRAAAEKLDSARSKTDRDCPPIHGFTAQKSHSAVKPQRLYARFSSRYQLPDRLNNISKIIFPIEEDPPEIPEGIIAVAELTRIIINEEYIKNRLDLFKNQGFTEALCGNIAAVKIARDCGLAVIADTGLNIYNSASAAEAENMGAAEITLSDEMLLSDISRLLSPVPIGIAAYGKLPLMLYRCCPVRNGKGCGECGGKSTITDRKGTVFPVQCRKNHSELLNSVPVWLADRLSELKALDFLTLYFTDETAAQAEKIINAYTCGGNAPEKYTRGLYYRGVY